MDTSRKFFSSKTSIVGLFAVLSILLTIPLALLLSQQSQDIRQRAAEPSPSVSPITQLNRTMTLSGYVYIDDNNNGQRDANEKSYSNATIQITQVRRDGSVNSLGQNANQIGIIKTDTYGYFKFELPGGNGQAALSYVIKLVLPDGYKTIDTNPVVVTNLNKDGNQRIEFGIFPYTKVSVAPSCMPRPACLDSVPRCLMREPASGWCPVIPVSPTFIPKTPIKLNTLKSSSSAFPEVRGD